MARIYIVWAADDKFTISTEVMAHTGVKITMLSVNDDLARDRSWVEQTASQLAMLLLEQVAGELDQ